MTCGIYCITNIENGKLYIGQAHSIKHRFSTHRSELRGGYHHNNHLQNAWNKYGEDSFSFEIMNICDESELDDLETHFIALYDSTNQDLGYNKETGGNMNKSMSSESCIKISESSNSTGYYRVCKQKSHKFKQGFCYVYTYYEHGVKKYLYSKNIHSLKNKVLDKKLKWIVINKENAKKTIDESNNQKSIPNKRNSSGIYRVSKQYNSKLKQGFCWRYDYCENGHTTSITSVDLNKLKEKVLAKDLEWIEYDMGDSDGIED